MNFIVVQTQKYEGEQWWQWSLFIQLGAVPGLRELIGGEQWWQWSLFIQGKEEDLDRIDSVTYTLHPTFPKRIRTVTNRATKFQLQCAGWGVFSIPIKVRLKSGETFELEHDLQFTFPLEGGES